MRDADIAGRAATFSARASGCRAFACFCRVTSAMAERTTGKLRRLAL